MLVFDFAVYEIEIKTYRPSQVCREKSQGIVYALDRIN
jgi:hypothetical protein